MSLTISVINFIAYVWQDPKYVSVVAYLTIQFYFYSFIYFLFKDHSFSTYITFSEKPTFLTP